MFHFPFESAAFNKKFPKILKTSEAFILVSDFQVFVTVRIQKFLELLMELCSY